MKDIKTKVLINLIHTNTGGGLIYLNNILPFLVNNKNFDIYIICQKKYRDRLELPKSVTVKEVNIIGGFYMVLLWEQFILPIIAWKIRAKATLCNAGFAPIFSPNPIIIIHNNARMFFLDKNFKRKLYWLFLIVITKISIIRCKSVCSVAENILPLYKKFIPFLNNKKFYITPAACNFTVKNEKKNKGQILTIGDFYPHKNYKTLAEVFSKIREQNKSANLIIVGRHVNPNIVNTVKDILNYNDASCNIKMLGALPHNEIIKLFATSEVYLSTSEAEAFNVTLLESMTMGLPSVVMDYDFQHEVAGKNGAIYIPIQDKHRIVTHSVSAVLNLLKDKKFSETIGTNAKNEAKKFSWKKTAETVSNAIYETIK